MPNDRDKNPLGAWIEILEMHHPRSSLDGRIDPLENNERLASQSIVHISIDPISILYFNVRNSLNGVWRSIGTTKAHLQTQCTDGFI